MTLSQERSINLALNMLHVGFFECPKQFYEYFVNNDEWALLMAAPIKRGFASGYGIPSRRSIAGPATVSAAQPKIMRAIPGTKKSRPLRPPLP